MHFLQNAYLYELSMSKYKNSYLSTDKSFAYMEDIHNLYGFKD